MNYDAIYKTMQNVTTDFYNAAKTLDGYIQRLNNVKQQLGTFSGLAGYMSSINSQALAVSTSASVVIQAGQCLDNARIAYLLAEQQAYQLISGDDSFNIGDGVTPVNMPMSNGGEGNKSLWENLTSWISNSVVEKTDGEVASGVLGVLSKFLKLVGAEKVTDNKELAFGSGLLNYASSLVSFFTGDKTGLTAYMNTLDLGKSSSTLFNAVYKFLEKTMDVYSGQKFDVKWGQRVAGVSMFGDLLGAIKDSSSYLKTLDEYYKGDKSGYDLFSAYVKVLGSGVQLGGSASIFYYYTPKTIQLVMGKGGKLESGLVTNTSMKTVANNLYAADALFSMVSTYAKSFGSYASDGHVSLADGEHVCLETAFSGIDALCFGLIGEENSKKMADYVYNGANNWSYSAADILHSSSEATKVYQESGTMRRFSIQVACYTYAADNYVKTTWDNVTSTIFSWFK